MKKSLIALAVTTATIMSGGVMAASWSNGSPGSSSFEMSGTLSPATATTPWEVAIGDAKTDLDVTMSEGDQQGTVNVSSAIPVLGIRSVSGGFQGGQPGIIPNITYGSGLTFNSGNSRAPLTLDVMNESSVKIGTLSTTLQGIAIASNGSEAVSLNANTSSGAFYGGVPRGKAKALQGEAAKSALQALFPEATQNWPVDAVMSDNGGEWTFADASKTFNAAYASGIPANTDISIALDTPLGGDTKWTAQLPVTVSFQ
ncbi:hypothetical protein ACBQ57_20835 [Escherichia coli]